MRRLFYLLFFASGFSALVYEVIWVRQLGLVFGNTIYAASAVLAIFFAGLSIGSYLFGRIIDRIGSPKTSFILYGLIEAGIGIYAGVTPWIFKISENPFGLAGLIIPTVLMGGTLPVVTKLLAVSEEKSGQVMGDLYSLNTLGGVFGAYLSGFFLVAWLGVNETVWLAAGINILIGITVFLWSVKRRAWSREGKIIGDTTKYLTLNAQRSLYPFLLVFFLSGFASLALEVIWTRVLILVFGGSTYAFSIILTIFLLGIALGSWLASRFLLNSNKIVSWFVSLEILLGIMVIIFTAILQRLPFLFLDFLKTNPNFDNNLWSSFIICFMIILPLTTIMGLIFPLGLKVLTPHFQTLGKDLGKIYGLNTLGGIAGSLAAGFVLIPVLGLQRGSLVAGSLYIVSGVLVLVSLKRSLRLKVLVSALSALVIVSSFLLPAWNKNILSSGIFVYFSEYFNTRDVEQSMSKDKILYYKEGLLSTVTVQKSGSAKYLRIDGKIDASDTGDLETVLLLGHLPMLLETDPKKVLVVGLGSGITLGAVEQYPVNKIDVLEIEPAVVEASKYFSDTNNHALDDKRLNLIVGDGRNFLLTSKNKYDVISSEPSNPWVKGNGNLFTQEYYQLARAHLEDDGVFLQWAHLYYLEPESLKIVMATFHSVFPDMTVWSPLFSNDLMLIGTKKPLTVSLNSLEHKIAQEKIKNDLGKIDIYDASDIAGLFLLDRNGVEKFIGNNSRLHTDNHPVLEFLAPYGLGKETVGNNSKMLLDNAGKPYPFISDLNQNWQNKIDNQLAVKENIFRAKITLEKLNFSDVINYYSKALNINPNKKQIRKEIAKVYFSQSDLYYSQKNFSAAKQTLQKVLEYDPANADAHLNLGAIYFQEGNIDGATTEWATVKEIEPENRQVDQNLKLLEKSLGQ